MIASRTPAVLPQTLYRAAQVRELDRIAIEDCGLPGATLMARAGASGFNALREHWPQARSIAVVCGLGNNAGDGFVLARLALEAGLQATVLQVGDAGRLRGDALSARQALLEASGSISPFSQELLSTADVIVEALFGTGLDREVAGEWRQAIEAVNASNRPVLALDIPSGLHADTGQVLGAATVAEVTISFVGLKQGLFTGQGPAYCGTILFNDLGVPAQLYSRVPASATRVNWRSLPKLNPRPRVAHKGNYGHVLVVGGDYGMAGAARMAAEAAVRVGAGLVSVVTRPGHAPIISGQRPELLCHAAERIDDLYPLLRAASVVAIGPGLGKSDWASQLFSAVLETQLPLVVDADALNLLSQKPVRRDQWILTPHPREAGRLLGCSTAEVQVDRFNAVAKLQERYGGIIILKGAGSLVLPQSQPVAVCNGGNPGMASAGMGDILTGIIAGLLAQSLDMDTAARLGVCLHAEAGDQAALEGERGMLAGDLLPFLRSLVNQS